LGPWSEDGWRSPVGFGSGGGGRRGEEGFGIGEEANDGKAEGCREEGVEFEERRG